MPVLWSGAEFENPRRALLSTSMAGPGGMPLAPAQRCGTWTSGPPEPRVLEEPLPGEAQPPSRSGTPSPRRLEAAQRIFPYIF